MATNGGTATISTSSLAASTLSKHLVCWFRGGVFFGAPFEFPFLMSPSLIRACFKVHNFCRRYYCSQNDLAPFEEDSAGNSVFFFMTMTAHTRASVDGVGTRSGHL